MPTRFRWKIAQAAELIWWKRYLKRKSVEEYLHWKKDYWNALLNKIGMQNADVATNKIADVGCGPAGIFIVFEQAEVDAVDPLLDEYHQQLPHFKKQLYPRVIFHNLPLELFCPAHSYDYVFCLNAINHVADLKRCIDKLVNAVAENGKLVLSVDAHNYSFLKNIFRSMPGDILHPHQYDLQEYEAMLTQRGCRIERTYLHKKERIFSYYILVASKC